MRGARRLSHDLERAHCPLSDIVYPTRPELSVAVRLIGSEKDIEGLRNTIAEWNSPSIEYRHGHWFMVFHEFRDIPGDEIVATFQDIYAQILGAACVAYRRSINVGIETSFEEHGDSTRNVAVQVTGVQISTSFTETGTSKERNLFAQEAAERSENDSDWAEILRCLGGTPYWSKLRRAYEMLVRMYAKGQRHALASLVEMQREELDDLWECLSRPPHDPKKHKPVVSREYNLQQATHMVRKIASTLLGRAT